MWKWVVDVIVILMMVLSILQQYLPKKGKKLKAVVIWIIVLTAVSTLIANHRSYVKDIFSQNTGALKPKYKVSYKQDDHHIEFNSKSKSQILAIQIEENVVRQPFGRNIPFSLERNKNGLLISMRIKNIDETIVAEIIRNKWKINPNNYFNKNFDSHTLEVIGQDGLIYLQIEYLDVTTIRIGGIFFGELTNISDMYHDFPAEQDNVRGLHIFNIGGTCMIIRGKGCDIILGQKPQEPNKLQEIRAEAMKCIDPWFDYSNPEKIGIRKRVASITISKIERKKYSSYSKDKLKDTVTKFVRDLREFTFKSNEEFFKKIRSGDFRTNKDEWEKKSLAEYEQKFKIESIVLRDELLSRLPKNSMHDILLYDYSYESPVNLSDCDDVAEVLENLVSIL
jgi:hypothetical protein